MGEISYAPSCIVGLVRAIELVWDLMSKVVWFYVLHLHCLFQKKYNKQKNCEMCMH